MSNKETVPEKIDQVAIDLIEPVIQQLMAVINAVPDQPLESVIFDHDVLAAQYLTQSELYLGTLGELDKNGVKEAFVKIDKALICCYLTIEIHNKIEEKDGRLKDIMGIIAKRDIIFFKPVDREDFDSLGWRVIFHMANTDVESIFKFYKSFITEEVSKRFPRLNKTPVTFLEQLQTVLKTPENKLADHACFSPADLIESVGLDGMYCNDYSPLEGIEQYFIQMYGIDSYHGYGYGAIFYEGALIGAFFNMEKKGDMSAQWLTKDICEKMRAIVLSKCDQPDPSNSSVLSEDDKNSTDSPYYRLSFASCVEHNACEFNEKRYTFVKQGPNPENNYLNYDIVIKDDEGNEITTHVGNVSFPLLIEANFPK